MNSDVISIARAFVAAVNRHSVADMSELMSLDHVFIDPSGREQKGREAMLAPWKVYFEMFPDYEISIDSALAEGDVVALFGQASGTFKTKRGLLPENLIAMPAAWKARVQDGRVSLWQVYADWSEGMKIINREMQNDAKS